MEPGVECCIHKGSTIIPILSRINPITCINTYFFKVVNLRVHNLNSIRARAHALALLSRNYFQAINFSFHITNFIFTLPFNNWLQQ